jgi:DNA-binding transcriptional ArsR family regulator
MRIFRRFDPSPGAKALNQTLSVPPDRNPSSLEASEREVPEQDTAALLAQLKANSERLFAALEAGAVQAKPVPEREEDFPEEGLDGNAGTNAFGADELKRLARLRMRRRRNALSEFFDWPTWDMLVDLTAVRAEGGHVSVSSVCIASGAPQSTALRKLAALEEAKLIQRYLHGTDRRRVCIAISDDAAEMVMAAVREEIAFYRSVAASR